MQRTLQFALWVLVQLINLVENYQFWIDIIGGVLSSLSDRVAESRWCRNYDVTQIPRRVVLNICQRDVEHLVTSGFLVLLPI